MKEFESMWKTECSKFTTVIMLFVEQTILFFNDIFYKELEGFSIASPIAAPFLNIHMHYIEIYVGIEVTTFLENY